MKKSYQDYIRSKSLVFEPTGFDVSKDSINPMLFDFQKDIIKWSVKKGRNALFTMTGTGKTAMQLEWSRLINEKTKGKVLIIAPLAVSAQTKREGKKFGVKVNICRSMDDVCDEINITNYEMIHHFDPSLFTAVVLDESSILKAYSGKIRNEIISMFDQTPYKLACTATPSPNDYMELGNHSEFLGVMSRTEMLSMFFVHDGGDTSKWRLKGHAEDRFWEWMASWSVVLTKPSDLGYDDDGFNLPPLNINEIVIPSTTPMDGFLFAMPATTLMERRQARRDTTTDRVKKCAGIVNTTKDPFLVWCDLNYESEMLAKNIHGAVEIKGAHDREYKEQSILDFINGKIRVLVTKPSIAGFGMNLQHCSKMAFVGLSDSFEQYFQAVRRCWRFGQKKPVDVYIITSELEGAVVANIKRKESDAQLMINEMVKHTKTIVRKNIQSTTTEKTTYNPTHNIVIPEWAEVS